MTCNVFKSPPMTLADAKRACGFEVGPDMKLLATIARERGYGRRQTEEWIESARKDWLAKEAELVTEHDTPVFLCGALTVEVCACGFAADYLCDYPIGRGKTCDLPLCESCRHNVAEERDLCLLHHAEFVGKAKVSRINPWPPPKKP